MFRNFNKLIHNLKHTFNDLLLFCWVYMQGLCLAICRGQKRTVGVLFQCTMPYFPKKWPLSETWSQVDSLKVPVIPRLCLQITGVSDTSNHNQLYTEMLGIPTKVLMFENQEYCPH